jgi:four helix bundle protein
MANHRNLAVLDAADVVADEINRLIDNGQRRLIHVQQLRKSAQSLGANIAEGFRRAPGLERDHALRVARGEAEETIRHLRANYSTNRIARTDYWRIHNRLVTIIRMLSSLLHEHYAIESLGTSDHREPEPDKTTAVDSAL